MTTITRKTAANSPFLAHVKAAMNKQVYSVTLSLYNAMGFAEAVEYMVRQFRSECQPEKRAKLLAMGK